MRWLSEHCQDWQISGLDKNPDVHEPGWIETGCAEKLPYPDQTADIILMECSCSKAAEPAEALREVYRVLKPEGWLLMSDMYARKKELFLDGMLGRLESAKTIRDRLAEAGFALAKERKLHVDDIEFSSPGEITSLLNSLLRTDVLMFERLITRLTGVDGTLDPQFEAWLIALGRRSEVEKWKSSQEV